MPETSQEKIEKYNSFLKQVNDYIELNKEILHPYFLLTRQLKEIGNDLVNLGEIEGAYDLSVFIVANNGWTEQDVVNKIFVALTDTENQPTIGISPLRQQGDLPNSFEYLEDKDEIKIVYHNKGFKGITEKN